MFFFRSHPPPAGPPTINAISTPPTDPEEERTQRHLLTCQRLIDLGMQLAEAAAARALQDLAAPPPETTTEKAAAEPRRPDPALTFTRLASAVRQTVALEARIAANRRATLAGHPPQTQFGPDLRGAILHPILRRAASDPARPHLQAEAAERLETDLMIYAEGQFSLGEILTNICRRLDLRPDLTDLPEELLDILYPDGPPDWPP